MILTWMQGLARDLCTHGQRPGRFFTSDKTTLPACDTVLSSDVLQTRHSFAPVSQAAQLTVPCVEQQAPANPLDKPQDCLVVTSRLPHLFLAIHQVPIQVGHLIAT